MKRFAILLGCQEYIDFRETSYCHEDMELLKDALIKYCDFAEQDIYYEYLHPSVDTSPKDILTKIESLVKKSEDGDTILFYYAGHGDSHNNESYLILPNTEPNNLEQTAIPLRDISDIMRSNNRLNIRIFDCCHSGYDARDCKMNEPNFSEFIKGITDEQSDCWMTFAACREDEYSYPDSSLGHGVFTYYFVEAIKDHPEEQYILPETLKVNVCAKVDEWSRNNNKKQTPTFNSSISGNVSIAWRKKLEVKSIIAINDNGKNKKSDKDILERIKNIRGIKKMNTKDNIQLAADYINNLYQKVHNNIGTIKTFGNEISMCDLTNADDIPMRLRRLIIGCIKNNKWDTLHEYKIEKIYEKDNRPTYMRSMFQYQEPKIKEIIYNISQDWGLPFSYFDLTVQSDEYLPEGKIFIYFCPLQIRVALIVGFSIGHEEKWDEKLEQPVILRMDNKEDIKKMDNLMESLINNFNNTFERIVRKRIDYYEWEESL